MFRDFYRMADELHRLILPILYKIELDKLSDAFENFKKKIGALNEKHFT